MTNDNRNMMSPENVDAMRQAIIKILDDQPERDVSQEHIDELAQGLAFGQMSIVLSYLKTDPDFAVEVLLRSLNMMLHGVTAAHGDNRGTILAHQMIESVQDYLDGNAPPPEVVFEKLPEDVLERLG
jgi:hypothetical protein